MSQWTCSICGQIGTAKTAKAALAAHNHHYLREHAGKDDD